MIKKLLCVAVVMFCLTGWAYADSIGGPGNINCPLNDCFGTLYTLQYVTTPDSSTATTQTFDIILTLDTTATTGVGPNLPAVAVKVSSMATGALESAPAAGWTELDGGLNANGCNGKGSGFVCASNLAAPLTVPDGTYVWVFDVTIPTGTLLTGPTAAHIKALYGTGTGSSFQNNGITSEDITLQTKTTVPEPATLALFGSGLLSLAGIVRRRLKK